MIDPIELSPDVSSKVKPVKVAHLHLVNETTNHLPSNILSQEMLDEYPRPEKQRNSGRILILPVPGVTQTTPLDDEPSPLPRPAGMSRHAAPPRMVPTIGARVTTGLRRGTLSVIVLALGIGLLAAGGYALASTPWISTLFNSQPSSPATQPSQSQPQSDTQSQTNVQAPAPDTSTNPNGTADSLRDQGVSAYKAGDYDTAINLLESSVNMDGGDGIAYYQLGLAYMGSTSREYAMDDAEMAFRTAVSLQPEWAPPYQGLAESLLRRSFYKEAIDPALKATQLDPSFAEAWMTLGRAYSGAGQDAEATQAIAQATRLSPPAPVLQP